MTPSRPYLIRGIYEWIVDNEMTPYIVINANAANVSVPAEYVEDGKIILNISPLACRGLHLENDRIIFSARFSGVATQVYAPPSAILAVYAKENGRGMVFNEDEYSEDEIDNTSSTAVSAPRQNGVKSATKKPRLTIVK